MRRPTRSALVALAVASTSVATAASTLVVAPTASAAVTQGWSWPSSGTVRVQGHGWGHGHGMSQWGAQGAATKGLNYRQIMAFYYPGTSLQQQAEPTLRVLVSADTDDVTEVVPTAGLGARSADGSVASLPTTVGGRSVTRWRGVRGTAGVSLQYLTDTWHTATLGGKTAHTYVDLTPGSAGTVRLVVGSRLREYRGTLRATPSGASPNLQTVVLSTVTNYLRSVVPSESPSSWKPEALKSQAVAARTYALFDRANRTPTTYDTCDTTACQVFSGVAEYTLSGSLTRSFEAASTNTAVSTTAGVVVTYGGALAFTQFSASNGGWTTDGGKPYLVAKADPYDGVVPNSSHSWTDTISSSTLESAYAVGDLRSVTLTRDGHGEWGGRVTQVVLRGTTGTVTVSGASFAATAGLKHSWWAPDDAGWSTYDVVVGPGDWDGDGHPDLLARATDGRLWLLPGPAAPLGPRRSVGTGFQVFTALTAPGDWDGDGHPDLLARRSDGSLYLYPGSGTGGFHAARKIGTGFGAFTSIVGPGTWDADSAPDLLARRSNGDLYLYRGNGSGGFDGWRRIGTGFQVLSPLVAAGRWDADSHPDLLARRSNGDLVLYPGSGTGGFLASRRIGTGFDAFKVLAGGGLLDGDTHPDLVVRTSAGNAFLYPSSGTGGFRPRTAIGTP